MLPEYLQHSNAFKAATKAKSVPLWASIQERFEGCPPDMSFPFQLPEDISENYLRSLISKKSKAYNRRFIVVKHADRWFEIGRIREEAQPVEEVQE